jgi:hypothetical protein
VVDEVAVDGEEVDTEDHEVEAVVDFREVVVEEAMVAIEAVGAEAMAIDPAMVVTEVVIEAVTGEVEADSAESGEAEVEVDSAGRGEVEADLQEVEGQEVETGPNDQTLSIRCADRLDLVRTTFLVFFHLFPLVRYSLHVVLCRHTPGFWDFFSFSSTKTKMKTKLAL